MPRGLTWIAAAIAAVALLGAGYALGRGGEEDAGAPVRAAAASAAPTGPLPVAFSPGEAPRVAALPAAPKPPALAKPKPTPTPEPETPAAQTDVSGPVVDQTPTQPVTQPTQPVTQPTQPVTQPTQPTNPGPTVPTGDE